MNYFLVWIFVKSQTDRRKAMHKSPSCISTGMLKNGYPVYLHVYNIMGLPNITSWVFLISQTGIVRYQWTRWWIQVQFTGSLLSLDQDYSTKKVSWGGGHSPAESQLFPNHLPAESLFFSDHPPTELQGHKNEVVTKIYHPPLKLGWGVLPYQKISGPPIYR